MSDITKNYKLNKPLENEKVNISVLNQNMDIIDTNLKSLSDKIDETETNIPSKTSQLINDSDFITEYTETDPTVPSWAKQATKPVYNATEVGALSNDVTHLSGDVPITRKVNGKTLNTDISLSATDVNADPSGSADSALVTAKSYTDTKISDLINGAPTTLDTLKEIADAMEENDSVVQSLESAISNKVDKVIGKGLSTNDLTDNLKSNYNSAYEHANQAHAPSTAQANVIEEIKLNGIILTPISKSINIDGVSTNGHKHTKSDITDFPTLGTASTKNVASSGNASESQVVMGNDTRLTDARKASDVYAWAKTSTKPTYTSDEVGAASATHNHNDIYYTETEINTKLSGKSDTSHTHNLSSMINTLTVGETAPTDNDYFIAQYANGGTTTTTYHRKKVSILWQYIKEKLSTVAITGSYNDLINKPIIPSVGNGTITITQNGTIKGTFTTNQSGNTTIALTDTSGGGDNNLKMYTQTTEPTVSGDEDVIWVVY